MAPHTRPDFDAIVVGAGAGGAAAAYHLVQAGLDTLVIERARLPRYKACGGAIPRPALESFPFDFEPVVEAEPAAARFTFPGLPSANIPLPERPVVMVMRSKFDAFLLARSGAQVIDGTPVQRVVEEPEQVRVEVGERVLTARYLVAADGAASRIARQLGLRQGRRMGSTLEVEVPLPARGRLREEYGRCALFAFGTVPWGYAWSFPKGDHLSIGIARLRPGRANLRQALARYVERLGVRLDGAQVHGHALPCFRVRPWPFWRGRPLEQLTTRRCVLVGDAAGLVDPLIGEGIRYALASGHIAACAIGDDDLSGYEKALWAGVGHNLATAALTAGTFYQAPILCYLLGICNPVAARAMIDVVSGHSRYVGLARRLILSTLLWPVDLVASSSKGSRISYLDHFDRSKT
ncbi:MAG: geranylgeranyl reductase family protein [Anaerolineae bacterium]|nr:geranylgeranyl reductase family protein [Anaerolineae bacterium]